MIHIDEIRMAKAGREIKRLKEKNAELITAFKKIKNALYEEPQEVDVWIDQFTTLEALVDEALSLNDPAEQLPIFPEDDPAEHWKQRAKRAEFSLSMLDTNDNHSVAIIKDNVKQTPFES